MRNLNVLIALFFVSWSFAQETETSSTKEKPKFYFTYGINAQVQDELNIDKKLQNAGLPTVKSFTPELFVGMTFFDKKFSGDLDFGFLNSKNDRGSNENRYIGFTTRLRVHYNVINKTKVALTTGLNLSNTIGELILFTKNNSIDLNDLTPINNVGNLSIKNNMFYAGPSASLYLFNDKSTKLRLNVGYEFAFTNGKWKSDYADVDNTVKEQGNNRFVFGFTIL
ncbi:hypothetical protein [Flavobacterium sp.]|uniref:hypothetical protein n=1 Tax=Flavobacterium sp. TaxID=239 RepID=UPI0026266F3F|nr:hypothetical protein [Flavobacterium sp.]